MFLVNYLQQTLWWTQIYYSGNNQSSAGQIQIEENQMLVGPITIKYGHLSVHCAGNTVLKIKIRTTIKHTQKLTPDIFLSHAYNSRSSK